MNPKHEEGEKAETVRTKLLEITPRPEWVGSEFGRSFTEKGIRMYFGE